jgi:hypothetical protein
VLDDARITGGRLWLADWLRSVMAGSMQFQYLP